MSRRTKGIPPPDEFRAPADPRLGVDNWPEQATPAEIARSFTRDAMVELARLMRDSESDIVRAQCATQLLDRAYGKPVAQVHVDTRDRSAEQVAAELRALRKNPKTAEALLVIAEASAVYDPLEDEERPS